MLTAIVISVLVLYLVISGVIFMIASTDLMGDEQLPLRFRITFGLLWFIEIPVGLWCEQATFDKLNDTLAKWLRMEGYE